ncbi:hypothetical protein ARMSODRAFT_1026909 [Armillaria solidipes]|uniref:Uncharacterized protein n=1 Tax=Armillaria solidipes TaxID=1076256 RepID=A0A2H3ATF9_9AGAR|nr:hypothetical protein ARMSODRAFT_1026909 [Armillaria solidipes]
MLPEPLAAMSETYLWLPHVETVHWEEELDDEMDGIVDVIPIRDMTAPEPTGRATSLIQQIYRKVLRHRRGAAKRGKAGLHAEIYTSCIREVFRLSVNPRGYLHLFPGPLLHTLLCLEIVRIDTLSQRKKMSVTDQANKAAVKLQQQLSPSSAFYECCDGKQLKNLVKRPPAWFLLDG